MSVVTNRDKFTALKINIVLPVFSSSCFKGSRILRAKSDVDVVIKQSFCVLYSCYVRLITIRQRLNGMTNAKTKR